jgi:hypothetical protein
MAHRSDMNTFIVITSIFAPTEAVRLYSGFSGNRLVVVGDQGTPSDWACRGATFLPLQQQSDIGRYLHHALPLNHYCRKMLGYLFAIRHGADVIVDTDDDNIPKSDFGFPPLEGEFAAVPEGIGFVNIYAYFTRQKIWPRGLPLRLINARTDWLARITRIPVQIGIWQGLADEDPDVDAIYRLTSDIPCYFDAASPVTLGPRTLSPFNTQNTLIRRELFPLLYLPTRVTFRYTDILRSLVAQPIMWQHGYRLGFTRATVVQKRNPHDYFKDFLSEIPMYQQAEDVPTIVTHALRTGNSVAENLCEAYSALAAMKMVDAAELPVLEAWLRDVEECHALSSCV